MGAVNSSSLATRAETALKERLISNELKPGDRLPAIKDWATYFKLADDADAPKQEQEMRNLASSLDFRGIITINKGKGGIFLTQDALSRFGAEKEGTRVAIVLAESVPGDDSAFVGKMVLGALDASKQKSVVVECWTWTTQKDLTQQEQEQQQQQIISRVSSADGVLMLAGRSLSPQALQSKPEPPVIVQCDRYIPMDEPGPQSQTIEAWRKCINRPTTTAVSSDNWDVGKKLVNLAIKEGFNQIITIVDRPASSIWERVIGLADQITNINNERELKAAARRGDTPGSIEPIGLDVLIPDNYDLCRDHVAGYKLVTWSLNNPCPRSNTCDSHISDHSIATSAPGKLPSSELGQASVSEIRKRRICVVALHGRVLKGILNALNEAGLSPDEDVLVLAVDETNLAVEYGISYVKQDPFAIGRIGMQRLIAIIRGSAPADILRVPVNEVEPAPERRLARILRSPEPKNP